MTLSRPLILRLSSHPREHPHLKWRRDASNLSRNTERVNDPQVTKHQLPRSSLQALATSTPELSESETNDSLGTYLSMLEQHNQVIAEARGRPDVDGPETEEVTSHRSKRAVFQGRQMGWGRNRSRMMQNSPGLSGNSCPISNSREVLRRPSDSSSFSRKISSSQSHQSSTQHRHPHSRIQSGRTSLQGLWSILHVISWSFAVSNNNREVERLGGMEVKFRIMKPVKQVRTMGDWFIAWRSYTKAAVYVFPHRKEEFDTYRTCILSYSLQPHLVLTLSLSTWTKASELMSGNAITFSSQIK